jgi:hypothetical protein
MRMTATPPPPNPERRPNSSSGTESNVDRDVELGRDLAHPEQITEAAGDAPASRGAHSADAVGSALPPRPEDVALGASTGTPDPDTEQASGDRRA